jgi:hypothetical protein
VRQIRYRFRVSFRSLHPRHQQCCFFIAQHTSGIVCRPTNCLKGRSTTPHPESISSVVLILVHR